MMTWASVFTLIMVVCKAIEIIDWSWWVVFSPVILVAGFWLIVMAASGFLLKKYQVI